MTDFHSEYREYCIWRPNVHGMWTATHHGHQLAADTLEGLRSLIRELGH